MLRISLRASRHLGQPQCAVGLCGSWQRGPQHGWKQSQAFGSKSTPASEALDEETLARHELGKRAHREVQVSRRRRREADDETVLFRSANAAGFHLCTSEDGDEAQQRRRVIDRFLTARAEELMDAIAAQRPLDQIIDFTLEVLPSRELPQPIAGNGVFIKEARFGEVPAGSLVAFYPGSVYLPHEERWLGGQGPMLKRTGQHTSSHIIGRVGGVLIDGLWSNLEVPAAEFNMDDAELAHIVAARLEKEKVNSEAGRQAAQADMESFRAGLTEERRRSSAAVPFPDHGGDPAEVRRANPLAVGEMINHPPYGKAANVLGWPVDLNLFDRGDNWASYARSAPNAYALRPEGAPAPGAPCSHTVVLVAAVPLKPGDELWLDYGCELLDVEDIPVWFTPAALRGDAAEKNPAISPAVAIQDELQAWRADFEAARGRKPSRQHLLSDPVAAALFETFQKYRKLGDL